MRHGTAHEAIQQTPAQRGRAGDDLGGEKNLIDLLHRSNGPIPSESGL